MREGGLADNVLLTAAIGAGTVMNGFLAFRIARSQAETARQKLRLDLYDRRLAVWTSVETLLHSLYDTLAARDYCEHDDAKEPVRGYAMKLLDLSQTAYFLFKKPVWAGIGNTRDTLMAAGPAFAEFRAALREGVSEQKLEAISERLDQKLVEYFTERKLLVEALEPYLDVSSLTLGDPGPEPASTILAIRHAIRRNREALADGWNRYDGT